MITCKCGQTYPVYSKKLFCECGTITDTTTQYKQYKTPSIPNSPSKVGTAVNQFLPWMGGAGCACKDYIQIMNKWGAKKCSIKRATLVDWIHKAAIKAGVEDTKEDIEAAILAAIKQHQDWPFVWTYWEQGAKGDEIKYSIRSLLTWYPDAQVVIIGDKPNWYNGDHIDSPRIPKCEFHAFTDCYTKLHRAAKQIPQFVWMMDDIYWVTDFPITEATTPKYVRYVTQQRYQRWKPRNDWAKTKGRAYAWLLEHGLPTYDFAAHLPQPIYADTFQEMEERAKILTSYMNWENIYYNMFYSKDAIDYGSSYLRITKPNPIIHPTRPLMNHTDSTYKGSVEAFLSRTFKEPCRYEN